MTRPAVDLAAHINQSVDSGHPANFPVELTPVYHERNNAYERVPRRFAVTRTDSGQVLAVVSDRYRFVPHQRILGLVRDAVGPLDVGAVPRGIYVDRHGARMRAIFKFPALAKPVVRDDTICPCLKIQNTYDGTSRIGIHIGAFRFVCTNLAVGGGGVFAGGFMSVHAGEIALDRVAEQLSAYLEGFDDIVALYGAWSDQVLRPNEMQEVLQALPKRAGKAIGAAIEERGATSVYEAYNVATHHATHQMRSVRGAFDLLERINRGFQEGFPVSDV